MYFRFVDDVKFSHNTANRPESKTTRTLRPVRLLAALGAMSHHVCRTSPTVRVRLVGQAVKVYVYYVLL